MKIKNVTGFIVPLLSILLAFIIGGIIMAALGANPFVAMQYLIKGSFGTINAFGNTLNKSTPLIFCGLCACFAYKCGVFNLGGEGQFLMGSITACVVGGVSMSGGVGKPLGVVIGTLLITVIANGLDILGVSAYWQKIIKGLIIVLAVLIDVKRKSKKN